MTVEFETPTWASSLPPTPPNSTPDLGPAPDAPWSKVRWFPDSKPTGEGRDARARFVGYIDAPECMRLLDEWVGPGHWWTPPPADWFRDGGTLWCPITVLMPDGRTVTKWDVGTPSDMQPEKGLVSDAFKRCAMRMWGVGRNVLAMPPVWAPCGVNAKGQAYPNRDTIPSIRRKLADLGQPTEAASAADPAAETGEARPAEPVKPDPLIHARFETMANMARSLTGAHADTWQAWKADRGWDDRRLEVSDTGDRLRDDAFMLLRDLYSAEQTARGVDPFDIEQPDPDAQYENPPDDGQLSWESNDADGLVESTSPRAFPLYDRDGDQTATEFVATLTPMQMTAYLADVYDLTAPKTGPKRARWLVRALEGDVAALRAEIESKQPTTKADNDDDEQQTIGP